jgi:hypothetical protein
MQRWNVGTKISFWALIVTIAGVGVAALTVPEFRKVLGLEESSSSKSFTGRVLDQEGNSISGAEVTLLTERTPITIYTESRGVFQTTIDPKTTVLTGKIRVEAKGYEFQERAIDVNRNQIEEIRLKKNLKSSQNPSSATVPSTPSTVPSTPSTPSTPSLPISPPVPPPEPTQAKETLCKYRPFSEGSSVSINPAKTVFSPLEPVKVSFSTNGISNEYKRWVGVVKSTTPENTSFSYGWEPALENSPVSLPAQPPGDYQVRLVIRTETARVLVGYCSITVQ